MLVSCFTPAQHCIVKFALQASSNESTLTVRTARYLQYSSVQWQRPDMLPLTRRAWYYVVWLAPVSCTFINSDVFPGWKGELPQQKGMTAEQKSQPAQQQFASLKLQQQEMLQSSYSTSTANYMQHNQEHWRGTMVQISWKPRVYLIKDLLNHAECDHLVALAQPSLTRSSVIDQDTGGYFDSEVRTSTGTFFSRGQDPVISAIEKRISLITHIPEENGEGLQVLRYEHGQKYEPHWDYFADTVNAAPERGGQRIATVLMYLSDVEEGGETVFPYADQKVQGAAWSDCARKGLAVKPAKGDGVLFYSLHPDATPDPTSLHGGCPVAQGTKYVATKWLHVGAFGMTVESQKAAWGDCIDTSPDCPGWAAVGECTHNPQYMLANCRKSCNACRTQ